VYPANKTLTATTGQRLSLTVEFCANPPASRTVWLTDTRVLRPGDVTDTLIAHNITVSVCFYTYVSFRKMILNDHFSNNYNCPDAAAVFIEDGQVNKDKSEATEFGTFSSLLRYWDLILLYLFISLFDSSFPFNRFHGVESW
jgi:hypothetical protein